MFLIAKRFIHSCCVVGFVLPFITKRCSFGCRHLTHNSSTNCTREHHTHIYTHTQRKKKKSIIHLGGSLCVDFYCANQKWMNLCISKQWCNGWSWFCNTGNCHIWQKRAKFFIELLIISGKKLSQNNTSTVLSINDRQRKKKKKYSIISKLIKCTKMPRN